MNHVIAPPPARLSPDQRAHLGGLLQQRQTALLAALREQQQGQSRAEAAATLLDADAHDATQHDADREVALARTDGEYAELAAVTAALARLEHPDYGVCSDCDAAIPFARLCVEPGATSCVACTAKREAAVWPARL